VHVHQGTGNEDAPFSLFVQQQTEWLFLPEAISTDASLVEYVLSSQNLAQILDRLKQLEVSPESTPIKNLH